MQSTEELRALVNKEIDSLPSNLQPVSLYEPIRYFMGLGGKRLRPVLLLMGCELFNKNISSAVQPSIGIELFHNFTLLHDDIMDKSPIRRNKATVHQKWNENVAILSGDAMFVKACEKILSTPANVNAEVMRIFLKAAAEVCEGQQLDMDYEKEEKVSVKEYLHMIELKTAVLLGASLGIGALIGGASAEDASLLAKFGVHIGIAFQLQDDILDVYGDEKVFGKRKGRDIVSNKKTFLLIKAMELAKGENSSHLIRLLADDKIEEEIKVQEVTAIYDDLNIREIAFAEMNIHFESAQNVLEKVNADSAQKKALLDFAENLMTRSS